MFIENNIFHKGSVYFQNLANSSLILTFVNSLEVVILLILRIV